MCMCIVFLFKQSRTFVVVRVPVWAQLLPCCHRAFRNKALITVALSVCAANNQMRRRKNIAGKVTRWEQKQLQYVSLKFCHLDPELLFAFAIAQHIIATVRNNYDILYSFLLLPSFLKLCQHIDSFRGGWWPRQERGWGDEKKTVATLTARWGNQKTRGNQKYCTWQSKDSPLATASNQKHPSAIKEPFSAIAVHTHKERKVHLPCVLVEDQPTLHACYQTRAHCGRRKIIVEIHHPALMSSSAEGGEQPLTRVEYGREWNVVGD